MTHLGSLRRQGPRHMLIRMADQLTWGSPLCWISWVVLALAAGVLLAWLTPLQGALIVGLLIVLVATLIEPLVGLAVALLLGLLRAYLHAEVPQVPAQIGQAFLALVLAVWLARGLVRRELRIPRAPLLLPLGLFVAAALISLWDAVGLSAFGLPELVKWLQIVLLFLFVSDHLSARLLPWLIAALIAIGVLQALVGIWQFGLRGEGPDHFAILTDQFYRAYGTFEQPNPYAGYLGLIASLTVGILAVALQASLSTWYRRLRNRSPHLPVSQSPSFPSTQSASLPVAQAPGLPIHKLVLLGAAAVVLLTALGMSWSRGAWVGFAAAVVAMSVGLPRKAVWGVLLVTVLIVGGLGLYAAGLLPTSITARLTGFAEFVRFEDVRGVGISDANYSIIERFAHWQAALEMFRHNIWTGVGFGAYEPAYRQFALINWPYALGHAHNYYLTVAAETGIVGLLAYGALWITIFWQTWRAIRHTRGLSRGTAIGLMGAWAHLSVHHLLDNLYVNNVHLQIGVMLGILAFLLRRPTEERVW